MVVKIRKAFLEYCKLESRAVFSFCRWPLAVKAAMVTILSCFAFKPSLFIVLASKMAALLIAEIKCLPE